MSGQSPLRAALNDDRGFTILEALIATAIVTLIAFSGLAACKAIAQVMLRSSGAQRSAEAIEAQAARFRNDAASAFAVFVPADDMHGHPNLGQELDFFSKAGDGRAILWRYLYNAPAQTVQRWDYDPSGAHGVRDVKTGAIDPAAAYPPLHVTRFIATAVPADRLGDPATNAYSGIGGLFMRTPQALRVRYTDPNLNLAAAVGGNGVVQVSLASETAASFVHLAAGSMPTGFTVTGVPLWHAIVYRLDQSHRFMIGVAGKSHVFINARVDVSYDHWKSKITWCDFNLLGAPNGLDGHDPHADYKPDEPVEQSDNILAACRRLTPVTPTRHSPDNPPNADAVHPPLPGQTAPPCWTRPGPGGRCWPANVAPDWTPPSPMPIESPPAAWCAAHAPSPACGGSRAAGP